MIILALDGGVTGTNECGMSKAVATVVVMILGNANDNNWDVFKDETWHNAQPIPIYVRTCLLPQYLGQEETTSTSTELRASNMAAELIPPLPAELATPSTCFYRQQQ